MSTNDEEMVSHAVVAYIGFGRAKSPLDDVEAVQALAGGKADAVLAAVHHAIAVSDSVAFSEVAPFDERLRERLYSRLRVLLPTLDDEAIKALGWRRGYVNFR